MPVANLITSPPIPIIGSPNGSNREGRLMVNIANLAARIMLVWGLTLAPLAFGQQGDGAGALETKQPPSSETNVESEPKKAVRKTGTVKFYNAQKGYGFIKPDDGGNDIFVHFTDVERSGIGTLVEGMRISFETEPGKRGNVPKAVNLRQ